jgi:hypothetical protein
MLFTSGSTRFESRASLTIIPTKIFMIFIVSPGKYLHCILSYDRTAPYHNRVHLRQHKTVPLKRDHSMTILALNSLYTTPTRGLMYLLLQEILCLCNTVVQHFHHENSTLNSTQSHSCSSPKVRDNKNTKVKIKSIGAKT